MKELLISILIVLIFGTLIAYFNRAPKRVFNGDGIVSPASGTIINVQDFPSADIVFEKEGTMNHVNVPEIKGPVHTVMIEMKLSDVHVQRAPIGGMILSMTHYDGKHTSAVGKQKENIVETNEKVVTVFKNDITTVAAVQVAGVAARRIRNSAKVPDMIGQGEVYGRIILGSQVVLIVPQGHTVVAKIGDKVVDGQTILAE
jgi:phosphatidylserine decarboxylase